MQKLIAITLFFVIGLSVAARSLAGGWPKEQGAYSAASAKELPEFPSKLDGFDPTGGRDYFGEAFPATGIVSVDEGIGWRLVEDFPSVSIDCIAGVYLLRWQLSDPRVTVQSTIEHPSTKPPPTIATGSFGYMYGSSCTIPRFNFGAAGKSDAETVKVQYEVRFWKTARQ